LLQVKQKILISFFDSKHSSCVNLQQCAGANMLSHMADDSIRFEFNQDLKALEERAVNSSVESKETLKHIGAARVLAQEWSPG
jgi:hypothetical protein